MFFHKFSDMTPFEREEYQNALDYMDQDTKYHSKITTNGAAKTPEGQLGSMYGIGWRGATTHGQAFGLYSPDTSKVSEEEWRIHMKNSDKVAALYKKSFKRLSQGSYECVQQGAYDAQVPAFGHCTWDYKNVSFEKSFSSNIQYTFGDYSNLQHKDNDINEYTFGIWYPTFKKSM